MALTLHESRKLVLRSHGSDSTTRLRRQPMAADTELCWTPATVLRERIRRRDVSPVEILDAVLARIEAVNPKTNAFLTLDAERARDAARKAESAEATGL